MNFLKLPPDLHLGEVSGVATNSKGHVFIFMRGDKPLVEFDKDGTFIRAFGEGRYVRPHGLRIDADELQARTRTIAQSIIALDDIDDLTIAGEGWAGSGSQAPRVPGGRRPRQWPGRP